MINVVPGDQCGNVQSGLLVLPVIASSTLGSDVEAAVSGSHMQGTCITVQLKVLSICLVFQVNVTVLELLCYSPHVTVLLHSC